MSTTTPSLIEQRAYGYAASNFLTFVGNWDEANKHYEAYTKLLDHYNDYAELDEEIALIWQPFEGDHLDDLLTQIDDMAQSIIAQVEQSLADIKNGMVDGAINGNLPCNYNDLDMKALAETGASSTT